MWYDPDAEEWKVCKEVGPWVNKYSFNAAVDIDSEDCIGNGANIYYVEIEQALAVTDKFMIHDENKYIDFEIDSTEYTAVLDKGTGIKVYSASALATEIGDAMNTAYTPGGDPFSASYSTGTHKFTITNDESGDFKLLWLNGDHGYTEDGYNAARLLGFVVNQDTNFAAEHEANHPIYSDGWSEREMAWSSPIWIDN